MIKDRKKFDQTDLKIVHQRKKKIIAGIVTVVIIVCVVVGAVFHSRSTTSSTVTYRETQVQSGPLTVGISESGSVDIGTVDQTFDLDLSAYVSSSSSSSSSSSGSSGQGGQDPFQQMMSQMQGGSSSSSSSSSTLEVAKVDVTAGQSVAKGDTLYELTDDSVSDIRDQMESDVTSAKADLDALEAENKTSKVTAKNTYDSSVAYGSYAQSEYDTTVADLNTTITDLQDQIAAYQKEIETTQSEITELQTEYKEVQATADAFAYSVKNMDADSDTANYVTFENNRETAQKNADTIETQIETDQDLIDTDNDKLDDLNTQLGEAQRALATGTLKAKEQYDLRMMSADTAKDQYDTTVASLELTQKEQEETYEDAQNKLSEFDSNISDGDVISEYAGTVTDVPLAVGDTISTGGTLLTLYDASETTITVDVDESDLDSLAVGGEANVTFTAYPDTTFTGKITEIDEGETDSSGNITYPVIVTLEGDTSGLFQDMTGELTFITKETEDVLYVSNRAIFRDGTRSYVKMQDENGDIVEKDVTTGFSDGENVEIKEGLSKGDTVLIESTVSSS